MARMTDEEVSWVVQRLRDTGCKVIETRRLADGSITVRITRLDDHAITKKD